MEWYRFCFIFPFIHIIFSISSVGWSVWMCTWMNRAGFYSSTFQFNFIFRMLNVKHWFSKITRTVWQWETIVKMGNAYQKFWTFWVEIRGGIYKMVAIKVNQNNFWFDFNYYVHRDVNISVAGTWNILNYY